MTATAGDDQPTRLSGEEFWALRLAFERVQVAEEDAFELRGTFEGKHGDRQFVVAKPDVYNLDQKYRGALKALDFSLSLVRYGESDGKRIAGGREAKALTGESFEKIEDWDSWLAQNRAFLFFSELANGLRVDERAKREGVPVLEKLYDRKPEQDR